MTNLDTPFTAIRSVTGTGIALAGNDIDTDRIIPARYLLEVTFDHLGSHAFEDDRKGMAEAGDQHPFDDPARRAARILVVAKNFGCGSSREHAPQALKRWGIQAVVGESFGEIFRGNCATIGLPCVTVYAAAAAQLRSLVADDQALTLTVDLEMAEIYTGDSRWPIGISDSLRDRLVTGTWDSLTQPATAAPQSAEVRQRLPYHPGWS
jgi:3-isopropylmalate/(R)-2-methylmalate dehydratase small subunit